MANQISLRDVLPREAHETTMSDSLKTCFIQLRKGRDITYKAESMCFKDCWTAENTFSSAEADTFPDPPTVRHGSV